MQKQSKSEVFFFNLYLNLKFDVKEYISLNKLYVWRRP